MQKLRWSVVLAGLFLLVLGAGCNKDSTPASKTLASPPALNTGGDTGKAKMLQPPEPPPPPPK